VARLAPRQPVPFKRFSKNLAGLGELPVAARKGQFSLLR
jgi:hypothetical protein